MNVADQGVYIRVHVLVHLRTQCSKVLADVVRMDLYDFSSWMNDAVFGYEARVAL